MRGASLTRRRLGLLFDAAKAALAAGVKGRDGRELARARDWLADEIARRQQPGRRRPHVDGCRCVVHRRREAAAQ